MRVAAWSAPASTEDQLKPRGRFVVEHFRNGVKIGQYEFPNGITNEGKNKLLDVMFHGGTPVTTWWLGMIDNAGYTALAATDTYANIGQSGNQWAEFTGYTDAANGESASTRPAWTVGAASGQAATNASPVVFNITGAGTVGRPVPGGRHRQRPEQERPRGRRRALGHGLVRHRQRAGQSQRSVEGDVHRQRITGLPRQRSGEVFHANPRSAFLSPLSP